MEYEFLRIVTDIKSKRQDFKVNYGYVLRSGNTAQDYGKDAIDFDLNGEPSNSPLVILHENVVIRDLKLMEALKKCDKEGTFSLSPESFISVIKVSNLALYRYIYIFIYIYIYIYIYIQASFVKDDGTRFMIFNSCNFSCVVVVIIINVIINFIFSNLRKT